MVDNEHITKPFLADSMRCRQNRIWYITVLIILYHYESLTKVRGCQAITTEAIGPVDKKTETSTLAKLKIITVAICQINPQSLGMTPVPARSLVAGHRCPTIADIYEMDEQ